ncbi:MAG: amino acid ABC transporter substrate-binding protein [Magnetovibrionaceae bacterium]
MVYRKMTHMRKAERSLVGLMTGLCLIVLPLAKLSAEPFRIGAPLALTGDLAAEGEKQEVAFQFWLDQINSEGGLIIGGERRPVELIIYDYQADSQYAGEATEALITRDSVDVLLAPFGSAHSKIAARVAERFETPILACASSSTSVYEQGNPYLFGTLAPHTRLVADMVGYVRQSVPDLETIAILSREDIFPKAMAEELLKTAEAQSLEVVYDAFYSIGTQAHGAALSEIKEAAPDWIYVTGYTRDLVTIREQMAEIGLSAKVVTMTSGPAHREFIERLGALANGITSNTWWHPAVTSRGVGPWPDARSFSQAFLDWAGYEPDFVHASCVAVLVTLSVALENLTGTDAEAIREALAKSELETFFGHIAFSENGMNEGGGHSVIQIQDGAVQVLTPPEASTARLHLFYPL